jgi:V/A-type H+-transporting ATPase subunit C
VQSLTTSFFDYGNARLKARISRLLTHKMLERLCEVNSVEELVSALTKTAYKPFIEKACLSAVALGCVEEALVLAMSGVAEDLKRFYQQDSANLVRPLLARYDLINIILILRGLIYKTPSEEIKRSLFLMGTIPNSILMKLAESLNFKDAINTMVALQMPHSDLLLKILAEKKAISDEMISLSLWKGYFTDFVSFFNSKDENSKILADVIKTEIDCLNLERLLSWKIGVASGALEIDKLIERMIPGGNLSLLKIEHLASSISLKELISKMRGASYYAPLQSAFLEYEQKNRANIFEQYLDLFQAKRKIRLIKSDPLGIGVPIGFLALKNIEIRNLRWIALGIDFAFESQIIKDGIQTI